MIIVKIYKLKKLMTNLINQNKAVIYHLIKLKLIL